MVLSGYTNGLSIEHDTPQNKKKHKTAGKIYHIDH